MNVTDSEPAWHRTHLVSVVWQLAHEVAISLTHHLCHAIADTQRTDGLASPEENTKTTTLLCNVVRNECSYIHGVNAAHLIHVTRNMLPGTQFTIHTPQQQAVTLSTR